MPTEPDRIQRDYPLASETTIGTGGSAEAFSRVGTPAELSAALAWAASEGLDPFVIGSGSNLLVADQGVSGLVLKLDGELAAIEIKDHEIICGGGARLPSVAAKAAGAGLTGLEFGVSIPGTVGGAVRMNANAYGGELARTLEWVEVATAEGVERRIPGDFAFEYRRSNLVDGEVVCRAGFQLADADPAEAKKQLADLRARRKEAQPWGVRTFGSTFKNPSDPAAEGRTAGLLLAEAGCAGLSIGGAGFSEKHANFVINHGDATTADVVAVMAAGRDRVLDTFGVALEPEVQQLGPVGIPAEWHGEAAG